MLPQKLRLGLAIFLVIASSTYQLPLLQAEPKALPCTALLSEPSSGDSTIAKLGANIDIAAKINGLSVKELSDLLTNMPTFHLDICGQGFYAESMIIPQMSPLPIENVFLPASIATKSPVKSNGVVTDYKSVLKLHSNPGSKKTIYLDFDGEKIEGTAWNKNFNNGATWIASGFSQDNDFTKFSESELEVIQSVWQRVAEDFAAFDIDVTTELPGAGVLERTNAEDDIYGTRALISNDTVIFNACKCSGLAYVGVFDSIGNLHDINQPAWIFTHGVGDSPKFIAEAVTHEVGHTLGLSHDGSKATSYYGGSGGWAPIMGVGFYQPITQWSKGDYLDANNFEDDIAIMKSHGVVVKPDEDEDSVESARILKENQGLGGVIATAKDLDYFLFTPASTTEYLFTANTATLSPDLDITFTLYQRNRPLEKFVVNPPIVVTSADGVEGLSVKYSKSLIAGNTYVVVIDGSAVTDEIKNSFTDYGSIGTYKLTVVKGKVGDKSPATGVTTNSPASTISGTDTLPDKLVLPVKTPTTPAPLELPEGKSLPARFGSRSLIAV